jgi:hypothetical protein
MAKANTADKAARFRKLAENRTNACLKQLQLIGNLSGSNYSYTPEQVESIFGVLTTTLAGVEQKFSSGPRREANRFSL